MTFDERELGRQMRELAATIVVPTAPPIARRGRFPLWPALASVAALVIVLVAVSQLATRDGQTISPGSPAQYEFQMLLGVTPKRGDRLIAGGHRLRVYVPYGQDWYAYSLRRLRENPEMAQYIARDAIAELFAR